MIAFHGVLTTVDYVDHPQQSFDAPDDSRCVDDDDCARSTVAGRRCSTRASSEPLETTCQRRLVSRGTQTSALARYIATAAAAGFGDTVTDDGNWLRRIDALDLSFPAVSRHSDLRCFLAGTLAFAEPGSSDGNQPKPRTPQMKRRRWAACDLHLDDEPATTAGVPPTALDDDPDVWTDDDGEDCDQILVQYDFSGDVKRPRWTPGALDSRSYFRSGCRTVSRHPAPNMPMIREDEQSSNPDDDDVPNAICRCAPQTQPPLDCAEGRPAAVVRERGICCRGPAETRHHSQQVVSPTSASPSLLDAMHKKYCASQYARHRTSSETGCHNNAHLLSVASRTPKQTQRSATHDSADLTARQTDLAERVTGSHVISRDCDVTCDTAAGCVENNVNAQFATTLEEDLMSSTVAADLDDDDIDEEEESESEQIEQEHRKGNGTEIHNEQPWKKRFCDYCHGEMQVKLFKCSTY